MRFRGFLKSNLVRSFKELKSLSTTSRTISQNRSPFLQLPTLHASFALSRCYSNELQPQLSNDIIKIMEHRLLDIEQRASSLKDFINRPNASPTEYAKDNKELRKLGSSMELINELRAKQKEINGLKSITHECPEDKEMLDMVAEELGQELEEENRLQNLLLKLLLPKDDADEKDCFLEVRAGTGGRRRLCLPWTYLECMRD